MLEKTLVVVPNLCKYHEIFKVLLLFVNSRSSIRKGLWSLQSNHGSLLRWMGGFFQLTALVWLSVTHLCDGSKLSTGLDGLTSVFISHITFY